MVNNPKKKTIFKFVTFFITGFWHANVGKQNALCICLIHFVYYIRSKMP